MESNDLKRCNFYHRYLKNNNVEFFKGWEYPWFSGPCFLGKMLGGGDYTILGYLYFFQFFWKWSYVLPFITSVGAPTGFNLRMGYSVTKIFKSTRGIYNTNDTILTDDKVGIGSWRQFWHQVGMPSGTQFNSYHQIVSEKWLKTPSIKPDSSTFTYRLRLKKWPFITNLTLNWNKKKYSTCN